MNLHTWLGAMCEHVEMRFPLLVGVIGALAVPVVAQAHIHLTQPLSRTDNTLGDPQKTRGCGDPGVTRIATRVTTYKSGQTITVKWAETIAHPGWYRISFQPNGETFRIPPASNGNAGDGTASNYPTEDLTGMTDPGGTGSLILKDRIPTATLQYDVTLPNIACTNCTLQVIMVMTNNKPYDADAVGDATAGDIYYQCADITLAQDPPDAGAMGTTPDAGGSSDAGIGGNPDSGGVTGGCSTGGATGLPVALVLLGLVGLRRRDAA